MEDKIEVNEYVRTKEGFIYKIENGEEFYEDSVDVGIGIIPDVDGIWIDRECLDYIDKRDIVKHSKNIIDLVEVGDYVNGHKVIGVTLDPAPSGKCVDIDCDKPSYESYLFEEQIYSIVTKEQFASIEYKIEEEK